MKILVSDKISPTGVQFLKEQQGFEVVEAYGSTPEQTLEQAKDAVAIIVRSETKITREVIENAPKLKAIGRAGVGVDNIDIDAATERGVVVMNTPTGNTIATAELTFTHMLCGTRPIAQACASMREGKWDRKKFAGSELRGKVLGILGLGRIGTEVAKRAQAFDMEIIAYDPFLTDARAQSLGVTPAGLDKVFAEADYITVHMPMTEATHYMIDEEAFAKMKDGVRLFNCARGGIIKESALLEALESGKVAAAGLDVYEDEPLAEGSRLRQHPNLVLTPHLGASTKEAQESVGLEIAEAITRTVMQGIISNAVNMPSVDQRTLEKLKPYLLLGERIGNLIQQLTPEKVNKLTITYFGKIAELDAMPLTRAIQKGYLKRISGEHVNDVNAPSKMQALGIEVETTKSGQTADYTELVKIDADCGDSAVRSISGTLFGRQQNPRVVELMSAHVEFAPKGVLLVLENKDQPGIVGKLGTVLGREGVNIGNLSLNRIEGGTGVIAVYELDSAPSEEAMAEIRAHEGVNHARIVHVQA